jgi:putative flavoprotein involved in K+ transport
VDALPGLYLLGKDFIFSAASETLPGVCRDAKYLAKRLAATRAPQQAVEVQSRLAA